MANILARFLDKVVGSQKRTRAKQLIFAATIIGLSLLAYNIFAFNEAPSATVKLVADDVSGIPAGYLHPNPNITYHAGDAIPQKRSALECLSSADGSEPHVVDQVKSHLRDPDSFEHIATRMITNAGNKHQLLMTYRSRNGFGGMVEGRATAVVYDLGDECLAQLRSMD